jgi:hypothetical protein
MIEDPEAVLVTAVFQAESWTAESFEEAVMREFLLTAMGAQRTWTN